MIGVNQYLTWEHFSEINKDTTLAFEKLSRALFTRKECAEGVKLHSNPNHPGVEVNPVLSKDGHSYISFQAKFFSKSVRYSDIKDSINTAIQYYGSVLDIIYIYCNLDIKDDCNSYKEIEGLANEANIKLGLITGQTILDQVVDYNGLVNLYFGAKILDFEWISEHVDISLKDLGKRYNSDFNIDTQAEDKLAFFLRDESIVDVINKKKSEAINNLYSLFRQSDELNDKTNEYIQCYIDILKSINDIDISTISDALGWYAYLCSRSLDISQCIEDELQTGYTDIIFSSDTDDKNVHSIIYKRSILERIKVVIKQIDFSPIERQLLNNRILFLTGDMGKGKSQILATTAKRLAMEKVPVLLLLGHTYLSNNSIELQILEGLNLENYSFDDVLAALEELALSVNKEAVIVIDAINETKNRNLWFIGLNHIISDILKYKNIKLIVSYRSGFESFLLSDNVNTMLDDKDIAVINHNGLADITPRRVYSFLSYYEIPFNPEFYLQHEMTNPLLLSWFCQTYDGKEQDLHSLINKIIAKVDQEASNEAGHSEPLKMLKFLINEIQFANDGKYMKYRDVLKLPVWEEYGVKDKVSYLRAAERGGILSSFAKGTEEYFNIVNLCQ